MKFIYKLFLVTLVFIGAVGCSREATTNVDSTTEEQGINRTVEGEYEIDITDLGMPLIFYLKIDADDNFYLSPDRTYTTDKGHGTVASSGDTYMLVYSDSTPEESKTSTFEFIEGNLHFQTSLPYGSSSLPASKEDENNPEIIYHLLGKTLSYEDYFGEYAGEHSAVAMGNEVNYDYYIELNPGRAFKFTSQYTLNDVEYEYLEEGYYDVIDDEVTLYLDEEVVGVFDDELNLTIGIKASEMGTREERVLQVATTAACANTYYGFKTGTEGTITYDSDFELILDKFGGYIYTARDSVNGEVSETGSFTFDGTILEFSPASEAVSYEGTLINFVLNAPFVVSNDIEERVDVTLYCNTIQGEFYATGEDDLENQYEATLELFNDGTFTLILEQDSNVLIDEEGTFTIRKFMLTQLILTTSDSTTYELVVSEQGLNVNFDLGNETIVGMILEKE